MINQPIHNKSDDPALEARLRDILTLLYSFYDTEIDMSLERVERFLKQLGSPHLKLPPVIHVAGTNGKGSTIATLRSLLEGDGKRVHVMTSPHLVHPTERIRLAGNFISTQELVDVLEECLAVNRSEPITFFEMLCAGSFLAMSRVPADYVLLETGMGGRLDATNVVPNPLLTIITTISKDHEKFLGDSLDKIAFEKAGIMKAGVPCVIGYQTRQAIDAGVMKVFHNVSTSLSPDAKIYACGSAWQSKAVQHEAQNKLQFTWQVAESKEILMTRLPNLNGPHQIYNTGAALAAYRLITGKPLGPEKLSPDAPNNPLGIIHWPGRLQRMQKHRLNRLNPSAEIWIDGGHNDSAGQFLAQQAGAWQAEDNKPLHLIIAMVNRKNPKEFIEPLLPYTASITCTEIKGEVSSFSARDLYDLIEPMGFQNLVCKESPEEAVECIKDKNARILLTGSLYFIGTILT